MDVNNVKLDVVAVKPSQYPQEVLPEFAFVGKSNVGKSSLLNAMINRRALARTSQTPGKTRTINFYKIEEALYFVDLPGYGYAKLSKSETKNWGAMIEGYLKKREQLKCIVMLVDIRHEPSKNDVQMFEWLRHYNYNMVLVATKLDKINRSQIQKQISILRKSLGMASSELIIPFSAETKQGKEALWEYIEANI